MAEVQESGPLSGDPGEPFTDDQWQTIFGSNAGIVGDTDGTAYALALPPATDTVEIGSTTIDSRSVVGGYGHLIPAGTTQSLEIPASTNPTVGRTDLIVARLNTATFTTNPGPVRLVRIGGTEGSANPPSHNTTLPSPVDLVLYAITRKQGQSLNQATVVDRRARTGWHYLIPPGALLPQTPPLGAQATRDGVTYRRDFDGSAVGWVVESSPRVVLTSADVREVNGAGFGIRSEARLIQQGQDRSMNLVMFRTGTDWNPQTDGEVRLARLFAVDRPTVAEVPLRGFARRPGGIYYEIGGRVDLDGWVTWHWLGADGRMTTDTEFTFTGTWTRA